MGATNPVEAIEGCGDEYHRYQASDAERHDFVRIAGGKVVGVRI